MSVYKMPEWILCCVMLVNILSIIVDESLAIMVGLLIFLIKSSCIHIVGEIINLASVGVN